MSPGNESSPCGCPEGFTRCAGRCLRLVRDRVSYTEGETTCASLGAHLATPRTEEENTCAADAVAAAGIAPSWLELVGNAWLGYRGGRTEESFFGADGCGPITYTNWRTGEPNLEDDDNCIMTYRGSWYDIECTNNDYILCQLENCHRPECD